MPEEDSYFSRECGKYCDRRNKNLDDSNDNSDEENKEKN